jgi:hypothetical protein
MLLIASFNIGSLMLTGPVKSWLPGTTLPRRVDEDRILRVHTVLAVQVICSDSLAEERLYKNQLGWHKTSYPINSGSIVRKQWENHRVARPSGAGRDALPLDPGQRVRWSCSVYRLR